MTGGSTVNTDPQSRLSAVEEDGKLNPTEWCVAQDFTGCDSQSNVQFDSVYISKALLRALSQGALEQYVKCNDECF